MKSHPFENIIGAFTGTSVPTPSVDIVSEVDHTTSSITPQSAKGSVTPRWMQVKDGVGQGQRNTAAAVMAGKLLSDLSRNLWSTAFLPAMVAWNRKNKPPLPDIELKQVSEGILKLEEAKLALAKQEKKERQSGSEKLSLISLITDDNCRPFHDQHNEPHAHARVDDHWETLRVDSKAMKRWLRMLSWRMKIVSKQEDLKDALLRLESSAVHEGSRFPLETRITHIKEAHVFLYDLSDPLWRAVRITSEGYSIVTEPGIHFRRFSHQERQVDPVDGGDLRELLTLTNLADADQELLFLVHLVSCLIPFIPHPVPNFHGPQGSAKTTLAKMERALIDPSSMGALSFPDKSRELVQLLSHHYMAFFDNVSKITQEQSDIICRAVTGEGNSKRRLHSDDEDMIYNYRRCVGFTGINPTARKPDLLDRSILIRLNRIPEEKRREERLVLEDFEAMRPRLVGAMFATLSKAMAIYPEIQLQRLPRMADFCRWGCAIARALGYDDRDFLRVYFANIKQQHEEAIQADQLSTAIQAFMEQYPNGWTGKASELLEELGAVAIKEKLDIKGQDWPKRANILSRRLNEIKTNLLEVGIAIEWDRGTGGTRKIILSSTTTNTIATDTSLVVAKDHNDSCVDTVQAAKEVFAVLPNAVTIPNTIVTTSSHQNLISGSQGDDSDDDDDHSEASSETEKDF